MSIHLEINNQLGGDRLGLQEVRKIRFTNQKEGGEAVKEDIEPPVSSVVVSRGQERIFRLMRLSPEKKRGITGRMTNPLLLEFTVSGEAVGGFISVKDSEGEIQRVAVDPGVSLPILGFAKIQRVLNVTDKGEGKRERNNLAKLIVSGTNIV